MNTINRITAFCYLNSITPCVKIGNSWAQPAAALIEGQPGIGKSAVLESSCITLHWRFGDVALGAGDPTDFGFPSPDTDRVRFLPPDWIADLLDAIDKYVKVVVMLDDFNWAAPAVQAAAMRVILMRRLGTRQLDMDKVRFVIVINPVKHAQGSYDMIAPVQNRVTHYKVDDPGVENFTTWFSGGDDDAVAVPRFDYEEWYPHFIKTQALVLAYLRRFPDKLVEDPDKAAGRKHMSYATRRSWTSLTLLLATCSYFGWSWAEADVIYGSIGEPIGLEFINWKREMDLGDPEEFLKDPSSVPFDAARNDRMFAMLNAIANAGKSPQKTPKQYATRWHAATECIQTALTKGCDEALCVVAFRSLIALTARPKGEGLSPTVLALHKRLQGLVTLSWETPEVTK